MTISKDDTVILDGAGDKKAIEERCEQVCVNLTYGPTSTPVVYINVFPAVIFKIVY